MCRSGVAMSSWRLPSHLRPSFTKHGRWTTASNWSIPFISPLADSVPQKMVKSSLGFSSSLVFQHLASGLYGWDPDGNLLVMIMNHLCYLALTRSRSRPAHTLEVDQVKSNCIFGKRIKPNKIFLNPKKKKK